MKNQKRKPRAKVQKLRNKADGLWGKIILGTAKNGMCEVCGTNSAVHPHHYIPKSVCGGLRLNISNGVPLCARCHLLIHLQSDPEITIKIKEKRGKKWYDNLLAEKKKIRHSFLGIKYYEKKIKELEEILNKK